ncbi:MAG: hypothetical protein V1778_02820, partial [bacterium]
SFFILFIRSHCSEKSAAVCLRILSEAKEPSYGGGRPLFSVFLWASRERRSTLHFMNFKLHSLFKPTGDPAPRFSEADAGQASNNLHE